MKLFGINFGSKKGPQISTSDRKWVEANFQWLITVLGQPKQEQISISDKWFPKLFQTKSISIDNLIEDFCNQLDLDSSKFDYQINKDLRDSSNMPYAVNTATDCFIHFDKGANKYKIELANNIIKHPKWLISTLAYEFSKVKLIESKVKYDTGNDTDLFFYLVAVFFGYGLIISNNLADIGTKSQGFWVQSWSYVAAIPYQVMAYALAVFAKIHNDDNPDWKKELPKHVRTELELSIDYLNKSDTKLFDAERIDETSDINKLLETANTSYQSGDFGKAIDALQKVVLLTDNNKLKATVYNNIGYYKLRLGEIEGSIPDFEKALKLYANSNYANDNLGFALIMTGKLEEGKQYVEKSMQSKRNNPAYSYRNLALYYQKKGKPDLAQEYFNKAFGFKTPVDLLNFYYGQFLMQLGKEKEGMKHIELSARRGEREGVEFLKEQNT